MRQNSRDDGPIRSGRELGEANRLKFQEWLSTADAIPENDRGGPNVSELERLLGISRTAFYTNPGLRKLLQDAVTTKKLRPIGTTSKATDAAADSAQEAYVRTLERRNKSLEQKLEAKTAEVRALREQLRCHEAREEHLTSTGRMPR